MYKKDDLIAIVIAAILLAYAYTGLDWDHIIEVATR